MNPQQYEIAKRRIKQLGSLIDGIIKSNSYINENGERMLNFKDEEIKERYLEMISEYNQLIEEVGDKQVLND